jgi:hypothetical protein
MNTYKNKFVIGLILSMLLLGGALAKSINIVQAAQARNLLNLTLSHIKEPIPGQVLRYSYIQYWRTPPVDLEPADPYHQPFREIWPSRQFVDSWIEVNQDGYIVRSRTQLRSENGTLLQDLAYFDGMHMDYFPLEIRADKYLVAEPEFFVDPRTLTIETFLQEEDLVRREGVSIDGFPVISVYGNRIAASPENTGEALLEGILPFTADLAPKFQQNRLDFDPETSLVIGMARVVIDQAGSEHVVAYKTYLEPEIIPTDQVDALFAIQIPEQAFRTEGSIPMSVVLTSLDEIVRHVEYPIYVFSNGFRGYKLESASLTIPETDYVIPGFMRGMDFAPALGIGASIIYTGDGSEKITVLQGPVEEIQEAFLNTRPKWTRAERIRITLGDNERWMWVLRSPDASQLRFIIEMDTTIVYIKANHLPEERILKLIESFTLASK